MSLLRDVTEHDCRYPLDPDHLYSTLRNERRRIVLEYLFKHDGSDVNVRELTDLLVSELSIDRNSAYVSLYQTHLPKLAELGFIVYDEARGTVSISERGRTVVLVHRHLRPVLDG